MAAFASEITYEDAIMILEKLGDKEPYFTVKKWDNADNKEYNKYYSVKYSILKDSIIELYKEFNELMKDKQDKYIVEHEFTPAQGE